MSAEETVSDEALMREYAASNEETALAWLRDHCDQFDPMEESLDMFETVL